MINIIILIAVLFSTFFGSAKYFTEPSNFNFVQSTGLRSKEKVQCSKSKVKDKSTSKALKDLQYQDQQQHRIEEILPKLDALIKRLSIRSGQCINPPVFSGNLLTDDVNEFILWYKHVGTANNWNQEQLVQYLCIALEGDAKKWYSTQLSNGTVHTWPEWESLLRSAFRTQNFEEFAYLQLNQRTQTSFETIQNYFHDIIYLCAKVNSAMSETEKVRHLLRGLQPEFLGKIMLMRPTDSKDFLEKSHEISRANVMIQNSAFKTINVTMPPTTTTANLTTPATTLPTTSQYPPVLCQDQQPCETTPDNLQQISAAIENLEKMFNATFEYSSQGTNQPRSDIFICNFCKRRGHQDKFCRFVKRQRQLDIQPSTVEQRGTNPQDSDSDSDDELPEKDHFHASNIDKREPFVFSEMTCFENL